MMEVERTFLIKKLPDLSQFDCKEIIDFYIPQSDPNPLLRIRKKGEKYELTKKEIISSSQRIEQNVPLTAIEFAALLKSDGKETHKIRYTGKWNGQKVEVDVFKSKLEGLAIADFEFLSKEEAEKFKMPEFCLVEITGNQRLIGGALCGKKYTDIQDALEQFHYQPIRN